MRRMVFGYAYPAYKCYKTVGKNKPEIEQLLFWCQYWILVAMLTVLERFGDALFSWVPIYNEAKLALFIYLWCSKEKGTAYLYNRFFRDFVAQHEAEIDGKILEFRVKTRDFANLSCQMALNYGQKGVYEILEYVSSHQSAPQPHSDQPSPPVVSVQKQEKGTGKVIAAGQSEAEARDQRTTNDFEEKPTESVSLSGNGTPILPSRKHWLKKLIK
ncbi:Abscisic acid-responsive TB2/DP1, HVA22 family protein [Prunus dulcis]|uniref:HVA22-like protein n=1 Tax=Prunus dulcis TaxID=3755 RepID=A0A4Y1RZI3_PRUDU|nr:Abscisic acid-responsive TB2/DP1, HVA22 family protein [Prunus dulcis]